MYSIWRISNYVSLTGIGDKTYAARWNNQGIGIVYATESPSTALLETLVHTKIGDMPLNYTLFEIQVPNTLKPQAINALPEDWVDNPAHSREIGTTWLLNKSSLMLRVPCAIMPESYNILINPEHKDIDKLKIGKTLRATHDRRFQKLFE